MEQLWVGQRKGGCVLNTSFDVCFLGLWRADCDEALGGLVRNEYRYRLSPWILKGDAEF